MTIETGTSAGRGGNSAKEPGQLVWGGEGGEILLAKIADVLPLVIGDAWRLRGFHFRARCFTTVVAIAAGLGVFPAEVRSELAGAADAAIDKGDNARDASVLEGFARLKRGRKAQVQCLDVAVPSCVEAIDGSQAPLLNTEVIGFFEFAE